MKKTVRFHRCWKDEAVLAKIHRSAERCEVVVVFVARW